MAKARESCCGSNRRFVGSASVRAGLTKPPRPFCDSAELAASYCPYCPSCAKFRAAFKSRSSTRPQSIHTYSRSDKSIATFFCPQSEQVFVLANHRSAFSKRHHATRTCMPASARIQKDLPGETHETNAYSDVSLRHSATRQSHDQRASRFPTRMWPCGEHRHECSRYAHKYVVSRHTSFACAYWCLSCREPSLSEKCFYPHVATYDTDDPLTPSDSQPSSHRNTPPAFSIPYQSLSSRRHACRAAPRPSQPSSIQTNDHASSSPSLEQSHPQIAYTHASSPIGSSANTPHSRTPSPYLSRYPLDTSDRIGVCAFSAFSPATS